MKSGTDSIESNPCRQSFGELPGSEREERVDDLRDDAHGGGVIHETRVLDGNQGELICVSRNDGDSRRAPVPDYPSTLFVF